ncbi:MAG: response regulator [Alphaproteobacteria bacterium]|nr:response regulator [Alphaproteobacteria bacterium]MBP7758384.1 response regulator [Alphaproteobacteria bacterium]MBP7762379.1 response regulator [Alphaproteobacteria bacterium]MBP7903902.1 response regulator [Alphaproteobacteria bacterium]
MKKQRLRQFVQTNSAAVIVLGLSLTALLTTYYHVQNIAEALTAIEFLLIFSLLALAFFSLYMLATNTRVRKSHEQLLDEHRAAHDLLGNRLMAIEAAQEGIAMINPSGALTYMNTAMFGIFGIPLEAEDQFIGESWLRIFPEKAAEAAAEKMLPALEQHGFWQEQLNITLEGESTQRSLDISVSRLPDGGLIATSRDVTERFKAAQEKKHLEEQFYQAQKMEAIGRLAGGIAHDFNNILSAISGYAEFLDEDLKSGSEEQKFAKNILTAVREAKALVDQMLAFSRRKDSAKEPVDIVISLQETVNILKASLPKTIEIKTDFETPQAIINGNASQIMQAFMNLCVNARDAIDNDRGEIRIGVSLEFADEFPHPEAIWDSLPDPREQPPTWIEDVDATKTRLILGHVAKEQAYIRLRLSDTGCGMSRVVMEHIFEPFFTTKPVNKGTGLGMATVHGVIVGHQAAMVIESALGQGTTFDLYFPADAKMLTASESAPRESISPKQAQTSWVGARILLVEDQDSVRDMMMKMLLRLGYRAESCASGLEALDRLREEPGEFDLVITDENMPKMTGTELVHQVHYDFPDIPFIMLTGYAQQQLEDIAKDHPAIKAILKKPLSKEIIDQQVSAVLTAHAKPRVSGKKKRQA